MGKGAQGSVAIRWREGWSGSILPLGCRGQTDGHSSTSGVKERVEGEDMGGREGEEVEAGEEGKPAPLEIVPCFFVLSFLGRYVWFCSSVFIFLLFCFNSFFGGVPHSDGRTGNRSSKRTEKNSTCHGPLGSLAAG